MIMKTALKGSFNLTTFLQNFKACFTISETDVMCASDK